MNARRDDVTQVQHFVINPWLFATNLPSGEWPLWARTCVIYRLINEGTTSLNATVEQFKLDVMEATNIAMARSEESVGQRMQQLSCLEDDLKAQIAMVQEMNEDFSLLLALQAVIVEAGGVQLGAALAEHEVSP